MPINKSAAAVDRYRDQDKETNQDFKSKTEVEDGFSSGTDDSHRGFG
jgi:hypothetical protein